MPRPPAVPAGVGNQQRRLRVVRHGSYHGRPWLRARSAFTGWPIVTGRSTGWHVSFGCFPRRTRPGRGRRSPPVLMLGGPTALIGCRTQRGIAHCVNTKESTCYSLVNTRKTAGSTSTFNLTYRVAWEQLLLAVYGAYRFFSDPEFWWTASPSRSATRRKSSPLPRTATSCCGASRRSSPRP